jgi:succinate dehydrogenase / fumarate reductase cytochrome b subunit
VTSTVEKKRAPFPVEFYRSAIGKKWIMAISGLAIVGFAVAHMLGNLKMFLPPVDGQPDIDVYGHALRELFTPILPEHVFLWILRTGLIVMFALHVLAAYQLTLMNRRARQEGYQAPVSYVSANYASRTMRWSGVIFLAFLIFHLADFTWGIQPAAPEAWERGSVYANFIETFNRPVVAFFYILAMVLLTFHLYHGIWSMFQSVGVSHPRYTPVLQKLAHAIAIAIAAGYISIPAAVLLGVIGAEVR